MTHTKTPAQFIRLCAIRTDECVLWNHRLTPSGYGQVTMLGRSWRAHRLALIVASCGIDRPEHHAAHSCRNRSCMNHRHLRWATPSENQRDRLRDGTDSRGEKSPHAKLTSDAVRLIRASDDSRSALAARFGVSESVIQRVRSGKKWTHVA